MSIPDGRMRTRVSELGLTLYGPHLPHEPLHAVVVHNGVARTSGQLPRVDGNIICQGLLGLDVSVEQGYEAARICALNALAVLELELGSLDRITRVLTMLAFVASAPTFVDQADVVDGATDVFVAIFGPEGRHTRSAIGVAALPKNASVEIEVTVAFT